MKAGILTEKIKIYRQVEVTSEYGDISTEYQPVHSYRANIDNKLGERTVENNEIVYDYSKTFKMRYYVDIDEKDRIEYNGSMYRVISFVKDKRQQQTTVLTELINE